MNAACQSIPWDRDTTSFSSGVAWIETLVGSVQVWHVLYSHLGMKHVSLAMTIFFCCSKREDQLCPKGKAAGMVGVLM